MPSSYYDINGNPVTTIYDILGNIIKSEKKYKTFSVLADSYGAFQNHTDPKTNAHYYPSGDIMDYTQMWWYLFGQSYGCVLDKCNAFSGSRIADDPKWFQGIEQCYISRSKNLGNPELIFVLGGTNDVWNSIPLGEYKYSNWSELDKQTFRGACSCLIESMKKQYPNTDIYFLCNTWTLSDTTAYQTAHEYYLSIHEVCNHYKIPCIDFKVQTQGNHPTAHGMYQLRNIIMQTLHEPPKVVRNIPVPIQMPAKITWNPVDNKFTVDRIEEGKLYKIVLNVTEIGGADSYIQVTAEGRSNLIIASFKDFAGKTGYIQMIVEANKNHNGSNVVFSINVAGTIRTATINRFTLQEVQF